MRNQRITAASRATKEEVARIRRAAAIQRAAAEPPARAAVPLGYSPEEPTSFRPGEWQLLAIRRGRPGTRDPRQLRPISRRQILQTLEVPCFVGEPQYAFPPLKITPQSLPELATLHPPVVVDCENLPACL